MPDRQEGIKPKDLVEGGLLYIGIPAYAAAILAALCLSATQTPALSLVRADVPEHGVEGAETCPEEIHGDTYVKLEEGLFYWHLYNKGGLFAVPETELHRIEYVHCARLLNRN